MIHVYIYNIRYKYTIYKNTSLSSMIDPTCPAKPQGRQATLQGRRHLHDGLLVAGLSVLGRSWAPAVIGDSEATNGG